MLLDLLKHLLRTTAFHELAKISVLSITLQPVQFGCFTDPSTIVPSLHRINVCIFTLFKPLASFLYATWSSANFLASLSEPWTFGNFNTLIVSITLEPVGLGLLTTPSPIVPSLHRLKPSFFKLFKRLASFSYATWSSATFLASWSEPRICWNFYTPMVSITLQPVGLGLFTASSSIVPSLYRLKPSIFKLFKPLASFSYAIWSSAIFLASSSEPWTCGTFNTLIVSITLKLVGLGLFTAPSTIVPWLHRLKPSLCKLFKPLASLSYATWSSATFLASWSELRTCGNFNAQIVSITLHPARFGFFTGPSSIVPSLHRQKVCIFTLFTPLALFSYATISSTTFLASYNEPWTHGSFYYKHSCLYDLDFSHVRLRLCLHCTDGWLVFLNS